MDYLTFYRLNEDPFRLTPDPHFFYPTREHNDALSSLEYVVEQREGFSVILGGPGTGKTTILRVFMEKWRAKADIALVMTPRLSPGEFLQAVLEDLGVRPAKKNKNEMIKAFRDTLVARSTAGKRVIIIVDEAQELSDETLEELRLLSNLETEKEKLLQIVLVGQMQLATKLSSERLEQLQQRIGVKAALRPLGLVETREYVNYRVIKAGKGSVVFRDNAIGLIHRLSKGIPRLINLFASRALMAAYLEGSIEVRKRHVEYARSHLAHARAGRQVRIGQALRSFPGGIASFAVAGGIVIVAVSLLFAKVNAGELFSVRGAGVSMTAPIRDHGGSGFVRSSIPLQKPSLKSETSEKLVFSRDGNLRGGPSLDDDVITSARRGAIFKILGDSGKGRGGCWYRVRMPDGGEAWVSDAVARPQG